ncbi:MAG: glycoside hydrolase family 15 protein [Gemmatimonadota bacterium]|nr:glycoside hydrolase family 15 protein [Gemmatimonadota bacterium]
MAARSLRERFLPFRRRMTPRLAGEYRAISDYALIGNRETCALVSRGGSIDWLCLPFLDSPSIFAALLDSRRGGRWRIIPSGGTHVTRKYLGHSAVLRTEFRGARGVLTLTDFFPLRGDGDGGHINPEERLLRHLRCLEGEVVVEMEWTPRPNYAREDVGLSREGDAVVARFREMEVVLEGFSATEQVSLDCASARISFRLLAGEERSFVCSWGSPGMPGTGASVGEELDQTLAWWEEWAGSCQTMTGGEPWKDLALRSGMILKLLTHAPSGAIAAAPTTSLPEEIGGVRNWDYRYCWVRDSSLIARAFLTLGHGEAARNFLEFLEAAAAQHHEPARIQVLYGLRPETRLTEYVLGNLDGYRDSQPVRIGNAAADQCQLDIYGELLQAAWELHRIGDGFTRERAVWLRAVASYVCGIWRRPDRGIWEMRGPERHFTHSKVMCWVALDRAIRLADELDPGPELALWIHERAAIHAEVLQEGWDPAQGSFVQCFGGKALDASNLLISLVGFLPPDDPRVHGTIDATLRDLTREGLVFRYRTEEVADGVGGAEGAFAICTFWLAQALAGAGRANEAKEIFEAIASRANDVGLFPEQIDPVTGAFLGNFPQAFTHVGLINAAEAVGYALHCEAGSPDGLAPA